jgi:hypothetical protein
VVHGVIRRASNFNSQRIDHLIENPGCKLCDQCEKTRTIRHVATVQKKFVVIDLKNFLSLLLNLWVSTGRSS